MSAVADPVAASLEPIKSVAERCCVSVKTIKRRVEDTPGFPRPVVGATKRGVFFFRNDVDAYLRRCRLTRP